MDQLPQPQQQSLPAVDPPPSSLLPTLPAPQQMLASETAAAGTATARPQVNLEPLQQWILAQSQQLQLHQFAAQQQQAQIFSLQQQLTQQQEAIKQQQMYLGMVAHAMLPAPQMAQGAAAGLEQEEYKSSNSSSTSTLQQPQFAASTRPLAASVLSCSEAAAAAAATADTAAQPAFHASEQQLAAMWCQVKQQLLALLRQHAPADLPHHLKQLHLHDVSATPLRSALVSLFGKQMEVLPVTTGKMGHYLAAPVGLWSREAAKINWQMDAQVMAWLEAGLK